MTRKEEKLKKVWESKGWKWDEISDYHNGTDYRRYFIHKPNNNNFYEMRIVFYKYDNTYVAFLGRDTTDREGYPITKILPLKLDIEMQSLITQTLTVMRGDEK